ncbi:hypothetical protein CAPTEDRAFT_222726 [Capitella teleta]|uniref:CW-type domain-containing protein n=1 Tax=Capitella teleta TaxID=283909 RepID=R7TFZ8_CAPTE|nr:hypothetical protein CAPTEDRAFT_222726 [Capitella teleta]|eukprot:ELT90466.1 hypothetical protein CAPTEDRAFT_222726 [Capitella teleta]
MYPLLSSFIHPLQHADNRAREAESKAINLENKFGSNTSKEQRADLRKVQTLAGDLRKDAQIKKTIADRKQKALRGPKTLNFIFGVNIDTRNQDGMFVYNCSRLIKMYQKVGPQAEGGVFCSGVVGVVDVPYLVLEPTHNKQDFADAKEYRHLQKAMGEHMVQYWKDLGIAQQGVAKFWENFGYVSPNWRDPASQDPKFIRKRAMQVQESLQYLCLKWRVLPFSSNNIGKTFPDDWVCSMNPDAAHNRCSASEQKLNVPEGVLKKEVKTKEQKEKELAEEIQKKQDILDKIQKTKTVTSSRHVREMEDDDSSSGVSEEDEPKPTSNNSHKKAAPGRRRKTSSENEDSVSSDEPRSKRVRQNPVKVQSKSSGSRSSTRTISIVRKSSNTVTRRRRSGAFRRITQEESSEEEEESSEEEERVSRHRKKANDSSRNNDVKKSSREAVRSEDVGTKVEVRAHHKCFNHSMLCHVTFLDMRTTNMQEIAPGEAKRPIRICARIQTGSTSRKIRSRNDDKELPVTSANRSIPSDLPEENPGFNRVCILAVNAANVSMRCSASKHADGCTERQSEVTLGRITFRSLTRNAHYTQTLKARINIEASPLTRKPASKCGVCRRSTFDMTDWLKVSEQRHPRSMRVTRRSVLSRLRVNGVVTEIDSRKNRWRVKLDKQPQDKNDKWVDKQGSEVKLKDQRAEKSGTPDEASTSAHEEIANGYRTCLRYFLPPQWVMDKDAVSSLSTAELAAFPLDDFFDHYEKGLRKLVSSFQLETETARNKLSSVRKMIAKLLKSINEHRMTSPSKQTLNYNRIDGRLNAKNDATTCIKHMLTRLKPRESMRFN